jgi:hypothetical protein
VAKGALPSADRYETNDDVRAHTARLAAAAGKISATLDYWDDPTDVYPVDLAARRRLSISLAGPAGTSVRLRLWSPQTRTIAAAATKLTVAKTTAAGARQRLAYRVPAGKGGRYYLQVAISKPGAGQYTLRWTRR